MKKVRRNPNAEKDREMRRMYFEEYRAGYEWGRLSKDLPDTRTPGQYAGYLAGKAEQRRLINRAKTLKGSRR